MQRGLNKEMYVCKSVYWSRQHSPEHGCDLNIFSAVKVTLAGGVCNYTEVVAASLHSGLHSYTTDWLLLERSCQVDQERK